MKNLPSSLDSSLDGIGLGCALRESASRNRGLECFKDGDIRLTFEEFNASVDGLVSLLSSHGIGAQDHVAVWLGNSLEWALAFFACARLGAVMVPVNTRYTSREAQYILAHSDAKLVIMRRSAYRRDFIEALLEFAPELADQHGPDVNIKLLPNLRRILLVGEAHEQLSYTCPFDAMWSIDLDLDAIVRAERAVDPLKPLIICYTSGTTGNPKGVMHDHRVMKQAVRVGLALDLKRGGRILGHMPLYHVAGLYMALVPAMLIGACFVNLAQWSPEDALDLIERERITTFGGIPTHFVDLCNDPTLRERDLSSLENAWIGGAPVMRSTFESFKEKLGIRQLMSTYGMTENTISTTFNKLDDPVEVCCSNKAPVLGPSEIKVVDVDTGQVCAAGVTGEILCRGETVMMGYYKDPVATAQALSIDGWLRTGDLGSLDENGYLHVTGRLKDMYKSGGINVYPSEIEQLLVQHPLIKIVSIVGAPDPRLGEVGFAFIQCVPGESLSQSEVREFCAGKIAAYKIPKYTLLVDDIPRTNTGKIEKRTLLKLAAEHVLSKGESRLSV